MKRSWARSLASQDKSKNSSYLSAGIRIKQNTSKGDTLTKAARPKLLFRKPSLRMYEKESNPSGQTDRHGVTKADKWLEAIPKKTNSSFFMPATNPSKNSCRDKTLALWPEVHELIPDVFPAVVVCIAEVMDQGQDSNAAWLLADSAAGAMWLCSRLAAWLACLWPASCAAWMCSVGSRQHV